MKALQTESGWLRGKAPLVDVFPPSFLCDPVEILSGQGRAELGMPAAFDSPIFQTRKPRPALAPGGRAQALGPSHHRQPGRSISSSRLTGHCPKLLHL